ncbi:hypothetical protein GLOTRDRAFT_129222 [Gloeophyllum trabeum ATCC 11539]|uniref:Uncharacterized protein n=1 Tax=Gloeophyllum trabeum (strain ATCC 11539 / FP-39264 / Madison 617) TaxID=670483 RepID=S7RSM2_GLOTA|nr:uncharacterized protein GLOTRDRAFT_129222 [Gloeophyllum trabeum ATCC 11539]EPQ56019.1 hypothetical protein GLOTRDRAFT_129222 [Gloeophyllum trabeum ATCC 11539]
MSIYQIAVPVGHGVVIELFGGYLVSWKDLPTTSHHPSKSLTEVLRLLARNTIGIDLPVLTAYDGTALVVAVRTSVFIPSRNAPRNVAEYIREHLTDSTLRWSRVAQMDDLRQPTWKTGSYAHPPMALAKDVLDLIGVDRAPYVYATCLQKPTETVQAPIDRSPEGTTRSRVHLLYNSDIECIHEGYALYESDFNRNPQLLYCPRSRSRIWGGFVLSRDVVDAWLHRRGLNWKPQRTAELEPAALEELKAELRRTSGKSLAVHRIHPLWKRLSYGNALFGTVRNPTWFIHTHNLNHGSGGPSLDQHPVEFCHLEDQVEVNSFEDYSALCAFLDGEGLPITRLKYEEVPARPLIFD